jgi:class 3 adenylate cyclase
VGGEGVFDFTALGDTVNTGARLQAAAGPGELVVSEHACEAISGLGDSERRTIELKGKAEPLAVRIIRPAPSPIATSAQR